MQSVVESLTVLAKAASNKQDHKPCDLEIIARQVVDGLVVPIKTAKATIHISSLPILEGDAIQFSRLFKNLVENALKFSKENISSEICIQSSLLSTGEKEHFKLPPDKIYYRIEIIDNGIGFKNEYAEKIFRPFVRLHGKSKFAGSGVGLAICKKIVENHHGIIYADSSEKEGTRLILILPQIL
jgi:signal transduction histidine kinase